MKEFLKYHKPHFCVQLMLLNMFLDYFCYIVHMVFYLLNEFISHTNLTKVFYECLLWFISVNLSFCTLVEFWGPKCILSDSSVNCHVILCDMISTWPNNYISSYLLSLSLLDILNFCIMALSQITQDSNKRCHCNPSNNSLAIDSKSILISSLLFLLHSVDIPLG